jgi:uncharacterized membrane protein YphA (DoxX/SURF4 family)
VWAHPEATGRRYLLGVDLSAGTFALWAARLAVGAVFALAAVAKFRDHDASLRGTNELGVPRRWAPLTAWAVPVLETFTSLLLIVPGFSRYGAGLGLALLALFTGAVVRVLRTGRHPLCLCFGSQRATPAGHDTIVRNVALGTLCLVILIGARG